MDLQTLLEGLLAPGACPRQLAVSALTLDSRLVQPGDVFLACAGDRVHGLAYADQARAAGAVLVLWEPPWGGGPIGGDYLEVPKLRARAGEIAARLLRRPAQGLTVIGVTGTDGKTSCAHFLVQCLDLADEPCGLIGTLGWGRIDALKPVSHTTPDPLALQQMLACLRDSGCVRVVMEVSSHGLDQGRVAGIDFDLAVLTNLSRDHLDYHGDAESYAEAKARLFRWPGLNAVVLNADDAFGRALAQDRDADRCVLYGLSDSPVDGHGSGPGGGVRWVRGRNLRLTRDGLELQVDSAWGSGDLRSHLLGRFNASNLLAVLSVLLLQGRSLRRALARIATLRTVPGRMERFGGGDLPVVVVDYAHTPHALEQVLGALREHSPGRLTCVFGCGGDRDAGKRPQMAQAAERWADRIIVTDDNPRSEDPDRIVAQVMAGFRRPSRVAVVRDRRLAINQAVGCAGRTDTVLIAGKGHEDCQLVGDRRLPFSDRDVVRQVLGAAA